MGPWDQALPCHLQGLPSGLFEGNRCRSFQFATNWRPILEYRQQVKLAILRAIKKNNAKFVIAFYPRTIIEHQFCHVSF